MPYHRYAFWFVIIVFNDGTNLFTSEMQNAHLLIYLLKRFHQFLNYTVLLDCYGQ